MKTLPAETVRIADIDVDDLTFSVGDPNPDDRLKESVRRAGIIHPPVVLKNGSGSGKYIVVSGHRRVRAAVAAEAEEIAVAVFEGPPSEAVLVAATEHSFSRELCVADMAKLVKRATEAGMSVNDVTREMLPVLGLKQSRRLYDGFAYVAGFCDLPGADAVSLSAVPYLMKLGEDASRAALELFALLRPGTNYQKEILSLAEEIALREGIPAAEVLSDQIRDLPTDEVPRARRIERVRDALFRRRNPTVFAYEEEFRKAVGETGTGSIMSWRHDDGFETPRLTAEMSFDCREELEDVVKGFEEALKDGSIDRLLDVCRCEVKIPEDSSDKVRGVRAQEDNNAGDHVS
ncbi:ParB N-terminal domain-containing protein [Planctomycetota bacterium]